MNFFLCLRFKCYPPSEICLRRVWTKFTLSSCRCYCGIVQWNKYKLRFCVWRNSLFLLIGVSCVGRGQMWLTIEPKKDEWLPYLINWKSIGVGLISTRVGMDNRLKLTPIHFIARALSQIDRHYLSFISIQLHS